MTAGYFSPLPPERTGVAEYSAALLSELRKSGTVLLNDSRADVVLYHLGNNQLHRPIYERALQEPGVIVLHDAVLQHFFLGWLNKAEYISEFVYNYGAWNEGLAERMWNNRARSAASPQYFEYPMLRRVVERSRGVIVHNLAAARVVREHVAAARVHVIPHLFVAPEPPPAYEVIRLRRELGVGVSECLFGVFGHLRESKRLMTVLRALRDVLAQGARVKLLVAGEFASSDLKRAVEPLLRHPSIRRAGYTPEDAFWTHAHAVDAFINLRYPTACETSGIAIRTMGIGKPVLLTAGDEYSDVPEGAALCVDPGPAETAMLAEYMMWLSRFPGDALAIGERARWHVLESHNASRVAALYWKAMAELRA